VGNNRSLRERLQRLAQQHKLPLLIAEPKHCGDNASMIAFAAWTELGLPEGDAAAPAPQLTVEAV
jgi:tRNA A37 threonylcarbamoyltransferase TsaD